VINFNKDAISFSRDMNEICREMLHLMGVLMLKNPSKSPGAGIPDPEADEFRFFVGPVID